MSVRECLQSSQLCHPALDSEISPQTALNGVDFFADSAFYQAVGIAPTSVYNLNLPSHIPPLPGEAIPVSFDQYMSSVSHSLPRKDYLSFATYPLI